MFGDSFNVLKFRMIQTGTYDDIYLRPYTSNYDQQVANAIYESTEAGTIDTPSALSYAANMFLQPSAQAGNNVQIVNGFDTKRFSFMLEVEIAEGGTQSKTRFILSGYTSHMGVSSTNGNNNLDPNMRMYFNNVFQVRDTMINTPNGMQLQSNLVSINHMLHSPNADVDQAVAMGMQDQTWMMRPEDVATYMESETNPIYAEFSSAGAIDARSKLMGPTFSSRTSESRPHYLSKVISSYKGAQAQSDVYEDSMENNTWSNARQTLRNAPVSSNRFMSTLVNATSYHQLGFVTYSELNQILEGLDYNAEVIIPAGPRSNSLNQRGVAEHWHGSNMETLAATIIQQSLPSIMADSLHVQLGFKATNMVIGGEDQVLITSAKSFVEGVDMSNHLSYLIERIKREILFDVSKAGQLSYDIDVMFEMAYDSHFQVSIDGGPKIPFTAPAFCDAVYAPVITNQADNLVTLAHDIDTMLSNATGDLNRVANEQSGGGTPSINSGNFTI